MEAILNADGAALLWIQENLRSGFLTPVMKGLSFLGDKGMIWILLTLALLFVRRTRPLGARCALSMVIGLIVTNLLIKNAVARTRPYELIEGLECLVGAQKDFSFPSGHATNSLACAWVLVLDAPKKWSVPALILALLICVSRLYVGVHYPTDVLAGMVIGLLSACLAMWLAPLCERRFPRLAERFYSL